MAAFAAGGPVTGVGLVGDSFFSKSPHPELARVKNRGSTRAAVAHLIRISLVAGSSVQRWCPWLDGNGGRPQAGRRRGEDYAACPGFGRPADPARWRSDDTAPRFSRFRSRSADRENARRSRDDG